MLCRLSELDVMAMKALQDRVNIVPVIAKADTLMPEELKELKKKVFVFQEYSIHISISSTTSSKLMKSNSMNSRHQTRIKRTKRTTVIAFRSQSLDPTNFEIVDAPALVSESKYLILEFNWFDLDTSGGQ